MIKVAVFTGTRADYGLLYWLLHDLQADPQVALQLLVTGSHLAPEFGLTYQQIEADGLPITEKVEMLLSSDTALGTAKSMGLAVLGYSDALARMQPDILLILGDRYEALAAAQSALILQIPILHIHGGELTQGAYDDAIRHCITKMSHLHATATECYRQRVIQLGEHPNTVKNVGALGLDHLQRQSFLSRAQLSQSLGFELTKPFFVVTYHPVTAADEPAVTTCQHLVDALAQFNDYQMIITYPNADNGGRAMIPILQAFAQRYPDRVCLLENLGQRRYLSALSHCSAVIGNSSSGLIEVPAFNVMTVNIGQRQAGRLAANSVLHVGTSEAQIIAGIEQAIRGTCDDDFVNPYGMGNASQQIISLLKNADLSRNKQFFDLERSL